MFIFLSLTSKNAASTFVQNQFK